MRLFCVLFLVATAPIFGLSPDEGLRQLIEGNKRYMKEQLEHPNRSKESREAGVSGQMPFATILGCSDSRVAPEIIFDQGIGDLFVVRVAGNIAGDIEIDSIEYSTVYLGSSLILVLGHEKCGAVSAVVQGQTKDIQAIASHIEPALKKMDPSQNIEEAIKANVLHVVRQLQGVDGFAQYIRDGKLKIVGGYYHLASGEVEILKSNKA